MGLRLGNAPIGNKRRQMISTSLSTQYPPSALYSSKINPPSKPYLTPDFARSPSHRIASPHSKQAWIAKVVPVLVRHLDLGAGLSGIGGFVMFGVPRQRSGRNDLAPVLRKGADFVRALICGFDVEDATALVYRDDLCLEAFEISDVRALQGEHLGRAIARADGEIKVAIENRTRARIIVAGQKIHILGGFEGVGMAREAVVGLVLDKEFDMVDSKL